jgi:hypothetical protein
VASTGKRWKNGSKYRNPIQVEGEGKRPTLPIYNIWKGMRYRCHLVQPAHKVHKYYRGRGIEVCPEWRDDYDAFYDWSMINGYQDDYQIDRIDPNGNYEPSNCRWVKDIVNRTNKRPYGEIKYKGVYKHYAHLERYTAILQIDRKSKHIGTYDTPEEAARSFDEYARSIGYKGTLNFPD